MSGEENQGLLPPPRVFRQCVPYIKHTKASWQGNMGNEFPAVPSRAQEGRGTGLRADEHVIGKSFVLPNEGTQTHGTNQPT